MTKLYSINSINRYFINKVIEQIVYSKKERLDFFLLLNIIKNENL